MFVPPFQSPGFSLEPWITEREDAGCGWFPGWPALFLFPPNFLLLFPSRSFFRNSADLPKAVKNDPSVFWLVSDPPQFPLTFFSKF